MNEEIEISYYLQFGNIYNMGPLKCNKRMIRLLTMITLSGFHNSFIVPQIDLICEKK